MNYFWEGFEKRAHYITDALKRLEMNTPEIRKGLAHQIRKNRNDLLNEFGMKQRKGFKAKALGDTLLAEAEKGGKSLTVEHAAAGVPHNIIERGGKTKITFPKK